MGWATRHIARLNEGETVQFRPSGHSMTGRVNHRDLVTVAPLASSHVLSPDDVVLCKVKGSHYLHLVKGVAGDRVLIGNNRGGINGWINRAAVYGILVAVET